MRKRYIALNLLFFGWLALAAGGNAFDQKTLQDRTANQLQLLGE